MEILDKLPGDLRWNVIKYLRHPLAEIIQKRSIDHNHFAFGWIVEGVLRERRSKWPWYFRCRERIHDPLIKALKRFKKADKPLLRLKYDRLTQYYKDAINYICPKSVERLFSN